MYWHARQHPSHGNVVFDLGIGLRRRLELALPGWISFSGWTWYRRFVGIRADVYRRNCACKIARTPGRSFPVQCSVRHSPRLFLELPDRASGLRSGRMALGIRRDRHPRGTLFSDAVWHPPEPTVAGEKRAHHGSERCSTDDRRGKLRARVTRNRGIDSCRTAAGRRSHTLFHRAASGIPSLASDRLHRVLCFFTRRRHLGLSERGVSQQRSRQGTELGQLHSLDHECAHLRHIPAYGSLFRRLSIYLLFSDDDRPVLCGPVRVSGNQRHFVGGDAEKAGAKPGPLKLKAAMKSPLSLFALLAASFLFSRLAFASDSQSPTPKAKTRLAIVGLDHDHAG